MVRLTSFTFRLGWPASLSRRWASSRDLLMSRQKPGIFSSSLAGNDQGAPGRKTPLTPLMRETLPRPRRRPSGPWPVSAPGARGCRRRVCSTLKVSRMFVTHGPSCTVTLSFIVSSSWSRSCGVRPRNSASYWPPRRPFTTTLPRTKMASFTDRDRAILAEVVVEPLPDPVRALDVFDELESARPHDLGLGVAGVLLELGGAVDAVERRCEAAPSTCSLGPA